MSSDNPIPRNAQGRIAEGNTGRRPGSKNKVPRLSGVLALNSRRKQAEQAAAIMASAGQEHLKEVVDALAETAKNGNPEACANFIRLCCQPVPRVLILGAEELSRLPPDVRLVEANRRMAEGLLDIASAQAIVAGARAELDVGFVRIFRMLMTDMNAGRVGITDVIKALSDALSSYQPLTIEHEEVK